VVSRPGVLTPGVFDARGSTTLAGSAWGDI